MSGCNVCLGSEPDEYAEFYRVSHPKARKEHKCFECERTIAKGQEYNSTRMKFDGQFEEYKTCFDCEELRRAFSCEGGSICFGQLWEEIQDYLFPEMTTGCLEKVQTASAKAILIDRWNKWKFSKSPKGAGL